MGIEEYKLLTNTLSDISSLSVELESERKALERLKAIKKQKEAEIGVLVEQLGSARNCSDEDVKTPPLEEMKNEIEEIETQSRSNEEMLDKLRRTGIKYAVGSDGSWIYIGYELLAVFMVTAAIFLSISPLYSFNCVADGEEMYPGAVLNGYESCSDGSDEWGDPDVSQQDRDERDLTEAEIYLLDNYRKAMLVEDILGVGLCFIWPLLWFTIIGPRLLQSDRFISKFPAYYIGYPKRYNKEINRRETERNSIVSEVAVKKAQMAKKAQNINYINNNPEKIEKENSGVTKLGERGATQLMKVRGLESKIETKWDSIGHLIPYSEMLDNQDS